MITIQHVVAQIRGWTKRALTTDGETATAHFPWYFQKQRTFYTFCTFYTFSVKMRIFPSESRRLLQPSGAIVNLDVWHQLFHRQGWKIEQDLDLLSWQAHKWNCWTLIFKSSQERFLPPAGPFTNILRPEGSPGGQGAGAHPPKIIPIFSDFLTSPWWFSF